jgi:hypothetical protein
MANSAVRKHFQFQQGPILLLADPVHSSCANCTYLAPVPRLLLPSHAVQQFKFRPEPCTRLRLK